MTMFSGVKGPLKMIQLKLLSTPLKGSYPVEEGSETSRSRYGRGGVVKTFISAWQDKRGLLGPHTLIET